MKRLTVMCGQSFRPEPRTYLIWRQGLVWRGETWYILDVIKKVFVLITEYFCSPAKVFATCCALAFVVLIGDGTLIQLWGLHKNKDRMQSRIENYRDKISNLRRQLELANQPEFVERKARDRFDLVGKDEIVFLFPEN